MLCKHYLVHPEKWAIYFSWNHLGHLGPPPQICFPSLGNWGNICFLYQQSLWSVSILNKGIYQQNCTTGILYLFHSQPKPSKLHQLMCNKYSLTPLTAYLWKPSSDLLRRGKSGTFLLFPNSLSLYSKCSVSSQPQGLDFPFLYIIFCGLSYSLWDAMDVALWLRDIYVSTPTLTEKISKAFQ